MSGREYARLRVDVWDDDDFRALEPLAQWLYLHLLTHPSLSFCGVVDWRPRRITAIAGQLRPAAVEEAMQALVAARFVVVDDDTEEALIRTFVRHDGLLASPNVTTAMVRQFRSIASRRLRGVLVHELRRTHAENPDLKGWARIDGLLERESIDPFEDPSGNPSPNPPGEGPPNPPINPSREQGEPIGEPVPHSSLPPPSSVRPAPDAGSPPSAPPSGGPAGGRERADGRAGEEPPRRCPKHLQAPAAGACGPCGDARRANERWTREREQARRDAGIVVGGHQCPLHPGERAANCGRCAATAAPVPVELLRGAVRGRQAS